MILVKDYNSHPVESKKEFRSKLTFLLSNVKEKAIMANDFLPKIEKLYNIRVILKIVNKNREYDNGLMLVSIILDDYWSYRKL